MDVRSIQYPVEKPAQKCYIEEENGIEKIDILNKAAEIRAVLSGIMKNYMDYVAIYNAFMKQYKLKRLSYREVDWYIWTTCKCNIQNILTTLI